jgi:hypothetical protein
MIIRQKGGKGRVARARPYRAAPMNKTRAGSRHPWSPLQDDQALSALYGVIRSYMPGRGACGISGGGHLTETAIILINCHDVIIGP